MKTSLFQRVRLEDGRQTRKLAYNYKKEDGRGRLEKFEFLLHNYVYVCGVFVKLF